MGDLEVARIHPEPLESYPFNPNLFEHVAVRHQDGDHGAHPAAGNEPEVVHNLVIDGDRPREEPELARGLPVGDLRP